MKNFNSMDMAALVLWLLPVAYVAYIYSSLPASVPVHFDIDGKPNGYGTKGEFLGTQGIVMGMSAFVYLLLKFLPAIDPKKYVKYGEATFQKLALGLVLFLAALDIAIAYATVNQHFEVGKLILPGIGLLFAFIGNIMNSIKPNYFAGVRTPWTLEDPDTWRSTHRLAGKLWFVGGIGLTITVLFLPNKVAMIVFFIIIAILVLIPVIYSYVYYTKHHPSNQN
ncbi:MAG: SdpI family protein [Bacteroidetes bacterium]|jgi:uncharacterized membrane protein|nr:SdpI family protein [Bacteroidota bacterium]